MEACDNPGAKGMPGKNKIAGTDSIGVKYELVTDAIKAPVELNVSPDNTHRMFITDNSGKVWILKNDSLLAKPFLNIYDKLGHQDKNLSLIHISEPTRRTPISYAVF